MRCTIIAAMMLLLCSCDIVAESDADKAEAQENSWWDQFFGRGKDSSDTCGYWGAACKPNSTTNDYGW